MTQVLLIRHAVNDFVKTGRLAGWTPEVHLNEEGRAQAQALGDRLADVGEVRYGDWEGQAIRDLQGRKMWQMVQQTPSRAYFPGGETMRGVQIRAVEAIEALVAAHPKDLIAVVTHADLIKMLIAHYLGMHLDQFQRIVIAPASISTLSLEFGRPYVGGVNDTAHLTPAAPRPPGAPPSNA